MCRRRQRSAEVSDEAMTYRTILDQGDVKVRAEDGKDRHDDVEHDKDLHGAFSRKAAGTK